MKSGRPADGSYGPSASRQVYHPPTDPKAPLDAIEQALVRALVRILVREIREDPACWIVERDEPATTSSPSGRRAG